MSCDKKLGWKNLPHSDTSSHKPYDILVGDTWTAQNVSSTSQLDGLKIYKFGLGINV